MKKKKKTTISLSKKHFDLLLEEYFEKARFALDKVRFQTVNNQLTYLYLKIRAEGALWIFTGNARGGEIEFYHVEKTEHMELARRYVLVKRDKMINVKRGLAQFKRKLRQAIVQSEDSDQVDWKAFDKAFFLLDNVQHPKQATIESEEKNTTQHLQ